jgi:hypothetical protein
MIVVSLNVHISFDYESKVHKSVNINELVNTKAKLNWPYHILLLLTNAIEGLYKFMDYNK